MKGFRLSGIAVAALAAAGLVASAAPSHAYRMIQSPTVGRTISSFRVPCTDPGGFAHWNIRNLSWYHNTAGSGSGKTAALTNAMSSWTSVSGANHVLTYAGTTGATWATDGQNTLFWGTGNGCTGTCIAITALDLLSGQVIVESDIMFNSAFTWTTNGSTYDTEAVAAHELGHSLGIHHTEITSTPRPTMYQDYFGIDGRSLHSDDQAALQCAESQYPPPACSPTNTICNFDSECCSGACWAKSLPKKCI